MHSIAALFGMEKLAPEKARALSIVYAASIALMMGVNFIQPALPALTPAISITDAQLSWIMTVFTAPAILLLADFRRHRRPLRSALAAGIWNNGFRHVRRGDGVCAEL